MPMFSPDADTSPFGDIPPAMVMLAAVLILPELVFQAGQAGFLGGAEGVAYRSWAMERFGFFDAVFEQWRLTGRAGPDTLWRFVTYGFVHWSLLHALVSVVLVLAMGKFASQVFRPWAIWTVFLASLAAGALVHGLTAGAGTPLLGAYPGAYGLIGLFTWMRWVVARMRGENQLAAFAVILVLVVLQSTVSVMDGNWHGFWPRLAGFATGFGLAWLVVPGGLAALHRRIRGR